VERRNGFVVLRTEVQRPLQWFSIAAWGAADSRKPFSLEKRNPLGKEKLLLASGIQISTGPPKDPFS